MTPSLSCPKKVPGISGRQGIDHHLVSIGIVQAAWELFNAKRWAILKTMAGRKAA